jgi:hypothetical protein
MVHWYQRSGSIGRPSLNRVLPSAGTDRSQRQPTGTRSRPPFRGTGEQSEPEPTPRVLPLGGTGETRSSQGGMRAREPRPLCQTTRGTPSVWIN